MSVFFWILLGSQKNHTFSYQGLKGSDFRENFVKKWVVEETEDRKFDASQKYFYYLYFYADLLTVITSRVQLPSCCVGLGQKIISKILTNVILRDSPGTRGFSNWRWRDQEEDCGVGLLVLVKTSLCTRLTDLFLDLIRDKMSGSSEHCQYLATL